VILYNLLRLLLKPIQYLFFFNPKYQERLKLELRYSFYQNQSNYDYTFEISSVGELEQVHDLIVHYLNKQKKVHLIFFSPSVESNCSKLKLEFKNLDLSCYPILSYRPFHFKIKTRYLLMVRYDFYPEIIANLKKTKGVLFSATHKSLKSTSLKRSYYLWAIKKFSLIFTPNNFEKGQLEKDFESIIRVADLRKNRILHRQKESYESIHKIWPAFDLFRNYLEKSRMNKIIFGSYWPEDYSVLSQFDWNESKAIVAVFPHNLGQSGLDQKEAFLITEKTSRAELEEMINEHRQKGGIWLFEIKGILCEMYSYFDSAYIGGGFGDSIHSLMEPHLASCFVYSGPNNKRSTEKDDIINQHQDAYSVLTRDNIYIDLEKRFQLNFNELNYPEPEEVARMIEAL